MTRRPSILPRLSPQLHGERKGNLYVNEFDCARGKRNGIGASIVFPRSQAACERGSQSGLPLQRREGQGADPRAIAAKSSAWIRWSLREAPAARRHLVQKPVILRNEEPLTFSGEQGGAQRPVGRAPRRLRPPQIRGSSFLRMIPIAVRNRYNVSR